MIFATEGIKILLIVKPTRFLTSKSLFLSSTNFIKSPADHFKTLYDWGKPSLDGAKLFQKAGTLISNSGIPAIYDPAASPKVLDLMFLELSPKTDINPNGLLLKILEKIKLYLINSPT